MRRRNLMFAAVAVLGVAALLVGSHRSRTPRAQAARFAAGTEYEYDLSWQSRQVTSLGGGADLEGAVDLRGRLRLRGYGAQGDRALVGVRFSDLTTAAVRVQRQSLIADARELTADEAVLELRGDGAIASIDLAPDASPVFAELIAALATQLEFRTGAVRAEAAGPYGTSRVSYVRRGDAIARTRVAYTALRVLPLDADELARATLSLESAASLELAAGGAWRRLDDHERLRVASGDTHVDAEVRLSLVLRETRAATAPRPALARFQRRQPGLPGDSGAADRHALEQKVAGLTRAELLEGLATGGAIADLNRWLWRASGLLEQDPQLAAEVGDLVAQGRLGEAGAALALDLLAAAGTEAAQRAMVVALSADPIRGADAYPLLLQRLSLLDAPTPETARFAAAVYADSHAGAAAYALGAVANRLAARGDTLGAELAETLALDLRDSDDPDTQAQLLGALGNAARADDADLIAGYASSADAGVRAAAAGALGRADTAQARRTVTALFRDHDARVQGQAIGALRELGVTRDELEALATHVAEHGVLPGNEQALVTLAAEHLDDAEAVALLQALAARATTQPEVRDRIASLVR